MPWKKQRTTKNRLTAGQKREVRRIVQSVEPKQWDKLFEVDPCACLAMQPSTDACLAHRALELAKSSGTAGAYGETVIHRKHGGLWFVPEFGADSQSCADNAAVVDDIRMRLALIRRQAAADTSFEAFDPFSSDWYEGDGVIWRHEHLFFSEWDITQVTQANVTYPTYVSQQNDPNYATAAEACAAGTLGEGHWTPFIPCGVGTIEGRCEITHRQARPYYWSSRHIPKNLRLKDGEYLDLIVGWCFSCATSQLPDMVVTGGVYGELSESTP